MRVIHKHASFKYKGKGGETKLDIIKKINFKLSNKKPAWWSFVYNEDTSC